MEVLLHRKIGYPYRRSNRVMHQLDQNHVSIASIPERWTPSSLSFNRLL